MTIEIGIAILIIVLLTVLYVRRLPNEATKKVSYLFNTIKDLNTIEEVQAIRNIVIPLRSEISSKLFNSVLARCDARIVEILEEQEV